MNEVSRFKSILRLPLQKVRFNIAIIKISEDFDSKQNTTSQAFPKGEGAGSLYLIPILGYTARGAGTSLDTHLSSAGCFALPATSRSRHGLFFCVQRVVLMETNS